MLLKIERDHLAAPAQSTASGKTMLARTLEKIVMRREIRQTCPRSTTDKQIEAGWATVC
jgi:hypothetical protein